MVTVNVTLVVTTKIIFSLFDTGANLFNISLSLAYIKHRICYPIEQDRQTGKIAITLGQWDEEEHKAWLRKNPSKKPKPSAERK